MDALRKPKHKDAENHIEVIKNLKRISINFSNVSDKKVFRVTFEKIGDEYIGKCEINKKTKKKVLHNDTISRHV